MNPQSNWQPNNFPYTNIQQSPIKFNQPIQRYTNNDSPNNRNEPGSPTRLQKQTNQTRNIINNKNELSYNEQSIPLRLSEDPVLTIEQEYNDYKINREKYIQTLISALKQYKQQISQMKNQNLALVQGNQEVKKLKQQVERLQKDKQQLQQTLENQKRQISQLTAKIRESDSLKQKNKQLIIKIDEKMKDLNSLKRQLNRYQKELKDTQKQLTSKQQQNSGLINEINELKITHLQLLNKSERSVKSFSHEDLKIIPVRSQGQQSNIGSPSVFSYANSQKPRIVAVKQDQKSQQKKGKLSIKLIPIQNTLPQPQPKPVTEEIKTYLSQDAVLSNNISKDLLILLPKLQKVTSLNQQLSQSLKQEKKKEKNYLRQTQQLNQKNHQQQKQINDLKNHIQRLFEESNRKPLKFVQSRLIDNNLNLQREQKKNVSLSQAKIQNKPINNKYQKSKIRQKHFISQFCLKVNLLTEQIFNSFITKSSELEKFMLQQLKQNILRFDKSYRQLYQDHQRSNIRKKQTKVETSQVNSNDHEDQVRYLKIKNKQLEERVNSLIKISKDLKSANDQFIKNYHNNQTLSFYKKQNQQYLQIIKGYESKDYEMYKSQEAIIIQRLNKIIHNIQANHQQTENKSIINQQILISQIKKLRESIIS